MLALLLAQPARAQTPVGPPSSPQAAFAEGEIAFGRGEFARAIELLRPLLYPQIRLESEGQVVRSHRMLGVALLYAGQPAAAREEFLRLLELRPDYRFDPLLDPQEVVDFFNQVLRDHEARIALLEARARRARQQQAEAEAQRRAPPGPPVVVERHYRHNPVAVSLVPFGVGQFQNGQPGKGWAFLAAESLFASVSIAALVTNFALHGTRPTIPCRVETGGGPCPQEQKDLSAKQRSERLTQVQVGSGALFFAVAAWGIIDALIYREPLVPLPGAPPAPAARAQLAPVLLPGGLAATLSLRF